MSGPKIHAHTAGDTAHDDADGGAPVKIGGKAASSEPTAVTAADRVNAYFDLNGRLVTVATGDVAHDSADSGKPVKIGGKASATAPSAVTADDRVNAWYSLSGQAQVAALVSDPVFVRLSDGSAAAGGFRAPLYVAPGAEQTYRAVFDDVALGNNKYVAGCLNSNTTYDVVIQEVRVYQANLTTATGVIAEFEFRRISALTPATAITPIADDPETDTLPASIIFDSNGASVSDVAGGLISRFHRTGEELILTAADFLLSGSTYDGGTVYRHTPGTRGLTLSGTTAANRGIAVKCVTNTTEGTINIEIVFTVRAT